MKILKSYQKLFYILLLTFVSISNHSCRRACFSKSLGELNCNPDYISVADADYSGDRLFWKYERGELVVINDIHAYKEAFSNYPDSMPLGYIDFSIKSLVGVKIYIDMGNGLGHQGCFCYNPDSKKWLFKIEYTLTDQCKGSGISSSELFCSIICPKLPPDAVVAYESRNVNEL